jgi:hypothetical protein
VAEAAQHLLAQDPAEPEAEELAKLPVVEMAETEQTALAEEAEAFLLAAEVQLLEERVEMAP